MIDVKQFVMDKFDIKRDLYLYNMVEEMDYNDLIQLLIEFQQRLLQQTDVSGSLPQVDWKVLRQKYFSECVVKDTVDGPKLRIDYAPHDLFEWFKREIQFGGNDR